jgi:hypothetical protein
MVDEPQVIEALRTVQDPELGESIVELGMVHDVEVDAPFLGRLPLDPELAERCDAGEIEAYHGESFELIAREIEEQVPEEAKEPALAEQQRWPSPRGR